MSEHEGAGFEQKARGRRSERDLDAHGEYGTGSRSAVSIGKRTLIESAPAEYTKHDAAAMFERAAGEARAQLAALASAFAAADRLAAVTATGSLQRSLRTARAHAGHGPAAGLAERQQRLAALEARAEVLLHGRRDRRDVLPHVRLAVPQLYLRRLGPPPEPSEPPSTARIAETVAREAPPIARALGLDAFDPAAQIALHHGDSPARREGARGVALGETVHLDADALHGASVREVLAHELVHLAQARLPA
ncbi:MAG TPA: DUF4157 domain-containing protein, partial [Kofleriaceae bacterium]|nr:DUF4157 domain-containing protein [Kofleriaceae bacterium]